MEKIRFDRVHRTGQHQNGRHRVIVAKFNPYDNVYAYRIKRPNNVYAYRIKRPNGAFIEHYEDDGDWGAGDKVLKLYHYRKDKEFC
jgi:hypothetical protein